MERQVPTEEVAPVIHSFWMSTSSVGPSLPPSSCLCLCGEGWVVVGWKEEEGVVKEEGEEEEEEEGGKGVLGGCCCCCREEGGRWGCCCCCRCRCRCCCCCCG